MLKPEDIKKYPWGNEEPWGEEHAQYVAKDIIKDINKSLKMNVKNINLHDDLTIFPKVKEIIEKDAKESGWNYTWKIDTWKEGDFTKRNFTLQLEPIS